MNRKERPDNSRLPNYFALISIAPALLAVLAYEFVDYMIHIIRSADYPYHPIDGLAILIPMALLMELFTFFLSRHLLKKITRLTDGIQAVARGDFDVQLEAKKLVPFAEVAEDFNKMTRELASVETLRANFTKDFSHEFKTPIVSIKGFADLLLEGGLTEEEQREYLTIIAEEAGRLSHLSEQTMFMAKLDSQNILTNTADYDLAEQLRQCIILLSPQWDAKEIDFDIDLSPLPYHGNAELMKHVWINLIGNAIKFTPEHGQIRVCGLIDNDEIKIAVTDTGIGMEPEVVDHIFNRYYQADSSHNGKGMGLGLSIAKKIIDLSSGSIHVTSKKGAGSTFTVSLPCRK